MNRLRGLELRSRGRRARARGHRLQVGIGGDEHDEIAGAAIRMAGGSEIEPFGFRLIDRAEIEHRLREKDSRVKHRERTDDSRKRGNQRRGVERKSERLEIVLAA